MQSLMYVFFKYCTTNKFKIMEFKKFNAEQWRKHYYKVCEEMTTEELQIMYSGIAKLGSIYRKYIENKYATVKRNIDLYEYQQIAGEALMKKFKEENEEVPY